MIKIGRLMSRSLFIFIFCFAGMSFLTAAQASTTVQSSVDRNEMSVGDTFTLTISAISNDEVDVQDPRMPNLGDFDLLNNWSSSAVAQKLVQTSSGMQFETQRRKEFHYMLSPKRAGTLSVSSFEVIVDGKVNRTQPVVIKVSNQGSANNGNGVPRPQRQQRPPRMPPGFDDSMDNMDNAEEEIFNQLLQQRQRMMQQLQQQQGASGNPREENNFGNTGREGMAHPAFRSLPTNSNEAFFISVEVDKTEAYEGEQITVNWYVYTRGQMETLDRLKFPDLRGFWKEVIEEVPSIQFSEEIVNGVPWKKALLASHALFPIKAGTSAIDEYKIKSRVRLLSQGQGWGYTGKPYEYTKSSARVEIKVKPLPIEGRPSDFSGAVGQFELHDAVENTTVPVNQPFSLKVRFEGSGNAKLIDLPALNLPSALEQYDSKSEAKFFKNGRSFKEFEVLLIPRQEGELIVPALSVSMFDPQSSKYYTRKTQPITLKIVSNPNAPVGSSQRMSDGGKPSGNVAPVENKLPDVILAWQPSTQASVLSQAWLWVLIFVGIVLSLLWKAQRELGWGRRQRTLKELIQKRYKVVDAALAKNDVRKVGVEMTNIFYLVMGKVSGEGGASQKIEDLLEMIPPSLRREHGKEITKSFEVFQTMSFAPEEMLGNLKDSATMKTNVEQAKKIISEIIQ